MAFRKLNYLSSSFSWDRILWRSAFEWHFVKYYTRRMAHNIYKPQSVQDYKYCNHVHPNSAMWLSFKVYARVKAVVPLHIFIQIQMKETKQKSFFHFSFTRNTEAPTDGTNSLAIQDQRWSSGVLQLQTVCGGGGGGNRNARRKERKTFFAFLSFSVKYISTSIAWFNYLCVKAFLPQCKRS